MKSLALGLLTMTLPLMLANCAFDKEKGLEVNKVTLRQNEAIDQTYGPLVGTYKGTMKTRDSKATGREEQVELRILIIEKAQPNADGSPGSKKVPVAYFKRTKPFIAFYLMDLSYSPTAGTMSLMNQKEGKDILSFDIKSLALKFAGARLNGPASTASGVIGDIDISRDSNEANAPADGGYADTRQSYLDLYCQLSGRYVGNIVNPNPKIKNRAVAIEIHTFNPAGSLPILTGIYFPLDTPGAGLELSLAIEYNPYDEPARVTMEGQVTGTTYHITIDGTLADDKIVADITNLHQGYLGKMTLKRTEIACDKK